MQKYNTKAFDNLKSENATLKNGFPIYRNGMVVWHGPIQTSHRCEWNPYLYPFDWTECSMEWLIHPKELEINVTFAVGKRSEEDMYENKKWRFVVLKTKENKKYIIKLKRRPLNIIMTLVLPCLFSNILILLVYLIPFGSGERLGYSMTLMLTFSVILMGLNDMVPSSNDEKVPIPLSKIINQCNKVSILIEADG